MLKEAYLVYKFIYVFAKETSDMLIAQGFNLVKSDEKNKIYIFENNPKKVLTFSSKDFVFSNTLTF